MALIILEFPGFHSVCKRITLKYSHEFNTLGISGVRHRFHSLQETEFDYISFIFKYLETQQSSFRTRPKMCLNLT